MPRVQITIPDQDRDRFINQAKREGLSLSAAAHARIESRQQLRPFETPEELETFFRESNAAAGPGREPDWDEHMAVMREWRLRG